METNIESDFITVADFTAMGGILKQDTILHVKTKFGYIDSCDKLMYNNIDGRENEFYVSKSWLKLFDPIATSIINQNTL